MFLKADEGQLHLSCHKRAGTLYEGDMALLVTQCRAVHLVYARAVFVLLTTCTIESILLVMDCSHSVMFHECMLDRYIDTRRSGISCSLGLDAITGCLKDDVH